MPADTASSTADTRPKGAFRLEGDGRARFDSGAAWWADEPDDLLCLHAGDDR